MDNRPVRDRSDVVSALVSEYKANGEESTIKLFDSLIKRYMLSQWAIRAIIIEFRTAVEIKV